MVAHVTHNFAIKTKFWNQKEAIILYGNEVIIKLRSFQSHESHQNQQASKSLRWATSGLPTMVAHE